MSTPAAVRVTGYHLTAFRRLWRATFSTAFFTPLFYLTALGLGLGSLIDQNPSAGASLDGVSYAAFIGPGLLAATGMAIGGLDSTWPVLASMKWSRTFYAMTATPLRAADVVFGHMLWMTARLFIAVGAFAAVMMLFDDTRTLGTWAAVPAGVLTGLAFAGPTFAWACTVDNTGSSFASYQRFVVMPMFLFSGTFFSVSLLPAPLEVVAWFTPLFHGVSLCRGIALGGAVWWRQLVHITFLSALAIAGTMVGRRTLARRLYA